MYKIQEAESALEAAMQPSDIPKSFSPSKLQPSSSADSFREYEAQSPIQKTREEAEEDSVEYTEEHRAPLESALSLVKQLRGNAVLIAAGERALERLNAASALRNAMTAFNDQR